MTRAFGFGVAMTAFALSSAGCLVLSKVDDDRIDAYQPCGFPESFQWVSSGPLIGPASDDEHDLVSIKDPTVVFHEGRWHIYATTATRDTGNWSLVYLSFADWAEAGEAEQTYIDVNPELDGYHAAPHLFYFSPHELWYLVFQSQQPQYSTTDDISDPTSWSAPRNFFGGKPTSAPELWIDYWVICDESHCYLFFTGDDGKLYRSRTRLEQFPEGMDDPVVALQVPEDELEANEDARFQLFEGSSTYKLKGEDRYLTLVEAIGSTGARYFRSFTADSLDGEWVALADSWDEPFAGQTNVSFDDSGLVAPEDGAGGASARSGWTQDISHGELLRDGNDQTMTVDACDLQLLYQGRPPDSGGGAYSQLPYRLALARLADPAE